MLKLNNFSKRHLGPASILSQKNEREIVLHIKKLQSHGFIPSRDCVQSMAFQLAKHLNIKFKFNIESQKVGYDLLTSFLAKNLIYQ